MASATIDDHFIGNHAVGIESSRDLCIVLAVMGSEKLRTPYLYPCILDILCTSTLETR